VKRRAKKPIAVPSGARVARGRKKAANNGKPLTENGQASVSSTRQKVKMNSGTSVASVIPMRALASANGNGNGSGSGNGNGKLPTGANGNSTNGHMATHSQANGNGHRVSRYVLQDRQLVDRCLGGEARAWSQMYARFHNPLLASIRGFLGDAGEDFHLIDEISARVWYALVRNDFELLSRFDPTRGCRLSTFLSVLAKTEARLLLRAERRRKAREHLASRPEMENPPTCSSVISDTEFLATLSPAERLFFLDILVATCGNSGGQYTQQNVWQLRHRVRKKLKTFLE
jgi:hypothetical protein